MVQFAKLSGQNRNLKKFSVFSPLWGHPCSTLRKFIQVKQVEHVKQDEQVEQDGQSWQVTMLVLKFRPSPTGTLQVWFSWTSWTSWIDWTTDILNCWKFEEVCLFFWTDVEPAGPLRYSYYYNHTSYLNNHSNDFLETLQDDRYWNYKSTSRAGLSIKNLDHP